MSGNDEALPSEWTGGLVGTTGLERLNVLGLRALLALRGVELDALVLVQALVTLAGDGGVVDEHVRAAAVGGDEAEALFAVEPLHGALCHLGLSFRMKTGDAGHVLGVVACSPTRPKDKNTSRAYQSRAS